MTSAYLQSLTFTFSSLYLKVLCYRGLKVEPFMSDVCVALLIHALVVCESLHLLCLLCICCILSENREYSEGLLSGNQDQGMNGVTMTPDTSTSTPAASSVSASSPDVSLSISLDFYLLLFLPSVVFLLHLLVYLYSLSFSWAPLPKWINATLPCAFSVSCSVFCLFSFFKSWTDNRRVLLERSRSRHNANYQGRWLPAPTTKR